MKKLPKIEDAADLIKWAETHPEKKSLVERGGYLELLIYTHNERTYPIENNRINTSAKVLGWIHHLCEKGGVKKRHIRALIKAAEKLGAKVDYNA